MEVVAKTKEGVLISATEREVEEILNAVTGDKPNEIKIGQKLPAIDYASTIIKIKALSNDSYFKGMLSDLKAFNRMVEKLTESVEATKNIEV